MFGTFKSLIRYKKLCEELEDENAKLAHDIIENYEKETELFGAIKNICNMNNYGNPAVQFRKIKELINDFDETID